MARVVIRSIVMAWLISILAACASSTQVLTGAPRTPISPAEVRVYTQAPQSFEEIAVLGASKNSVSSGGGERAIAHMIESMRTQAARLGANGLLLEDFSDADRHAIGVTSGKQNADFVARRNSTFRAHAVATSERNNDRAAERNAATGIDGG